MESRFFCLSSIALIALVGCQVKTRQGIDEALQALEADVATARRLEGGGGMDLGELEARAKQIANSFGQGDPRWHRAIQALNRIRETSLRAESQDTERELERIASDHLVRVESTHSQTAIPGRPTTEMTAIDALIEEVEKERMAERQAVAAPRRQADADFDVPWTPAATGDLGREEDFEPPPGPAEAVVQVAKPPIVVTKLDYRRPHAIAHVTFTPGVSCVFGSVSGNFLVRRDKQVGRVIVTFLEQDFEANWDDIFSSTGTAVTAGVVRMDKDGSVNLVVIGRVESKPESVKLELRTSDSQFSGQGP